MARRTGVLSGMSRRARWGVRVWTLGVIVVATALVMFVPVTWNAHQLHHQAKARAIQLDVRETSRCGRCGMSTHVTAWFPDADGVMERAALRGVAQDSTYYRRGITVVYDLTDPRRAMAARDFRDGSGRLSTVVISLALLMALIAVVVAVRFLRRRSPVALAKRHR
jgi:hypothetical protein